MSPAANLRNPPDPSTSNPVAPPSAQPSSANRSIRDVPSPHAGPSNKGKAKAEGKTKVKEKKVHRCTYEGCDKTFITLAHVRRHLRTRELFGFSDLGPHFVFLTLFFPVSLAVPTSRRTPLIESIFLLLRYQHPALSLRILRKAICAERCSESAHAAFA
jgi:hypothetical protein